MDILHSVIKETLRLHSPAIGIGVRTALSDHKILDLDVKKGNIVRADFYSSFYDGRHFESPEKFDPERWSLESKLNPYAYIPFSAGPRNCIGQHLAIIETKILVSEFLNRFSFKLDEGYQLKMTVRMLYEPIDELVFELNPINSK